MTFISPSFPVTSSNTTIGSTPLTEAEISTLEQQCAAIAAQNPARLSGSNIFFASFDGTNNGINNSGNPA